MAGVLLYLGQEGRKHSRIQARLGELAIVRDQLQQQLDDQSILMGRLMSAYQVIPTEPFPSGSQFSEPLNRLKVGLGQFEAEYRSTKLTPDEKLELRLHQATVAYAEKRFPEILTLVPEVGQDSASLQTAEQTNRFLRATHIRGDAFFYRHEWQSALAHYQKVLPLQSNHIALLARMTICQRALGNTNETKQLSKALVESLTQRGHALMLHGKSDIALLNYDQAGQVLMLSGALPAEVAANQIHCGNASFLRGQADAAIEHYEQALQIFAQLGDQAGQGLSVAKTHGNLAIVLLGQQKLEAALNHLERAIAILSRMNDAAAHAEMALVLNNRGVLRWLQSRSDTAIADLDKAIELQTSLASVTPAGKASMLDDIKLNVALALTDKSIDVVTRARPANEAPSDLLALSLKNRGGLQLAQGKASDALNDFQKALEIYTRLVEREGQRDLTLQYARTLTALAWIHAANPEASLRDGSKAKTYATHACELSEWKNYASLEALAAANAEVGDFVAAIKWQKAALELAPSAQKSEANSRLALYQSNKPYRTSPVK